MQGARASSRATQLDLALAAALTVATLLETYATTEAHVALRVALACVVPLGLVGRRRQPALSVMVVAAGLAVESVATESPDQIAVLLCLLVSSFSVAAYADKREALLGLGLLGSAIALTISVDPSDSLSNIPPTLVLFLGVPSVLGFAFRRRGRDLVVLRLHNDVLRQESETAIEDERRRIARDLHDVVSHAVTLIAVQAEAGEHLLDADPEAARRSLVAIGATSRDALAELQTMLSLLREPDDETADQPRGLDRLEALVEGARTAGVRVSIVEHGAASHVAPATDQAAFRVVQEAITNALRHSQSPRVSIVVDHEPDRIWLRVDSAGAAHQSSYGGTGTGLAGLRERVLGLGGTFEAGPTGPDLYSVAASLPREAP